MGFVTNVCLLDSPPVVGGWAPTLFDAVAPVAGASSPTRVDLGAGAWLDIAPGFLAGAAPVFDDVLASVAWQAQTRPMYDRIVAVPRLLGVARDQSGLHPALADVGAALDHHYGVHFHHVSYALYRDGADSVAPHGDTVDDAAGDPNVAILSLGAPRRFVVTPVDAGAARGTRVTVHSGDLVVMGGRIQRTHRHGVPKLAAAGPRLAVMFRHGRVLEP